MGSGTSEIAAQHLSSRVLAPAFILARKRGGEEAVESLLQASELDRARALDPNEWVSLDAANRVYGSLCDVLGDEEAAFEAGLEFVSRDVIGAIWHVARALGSPDVLLRQFSAMSAKFSRISWWTYEPHRPGNATIKFVLHEGFDDNSTYCDHRRGILTGIPLMWGLPLARVEHPLCRVRDEAAHCEYEVQWVPRGRLYPVLGLLLGPTSVAGAAMAPAYGPAAIVPALVVGTGFLLARLVDKIRVDNLTHMETKAQLLELRRSHDAVERGAADLRILRRLDEATRELRQPADLLELATEILGQRRRFDVVRAVDPEEPALKTRRTLAAWLGVRSAACVEVRSPTDRIAILAVGSRDEHITVSDERLLEQAANTVSLAVEAGRSLERLDALVQERTAQLEAATERLVSQARMASVGQLVDGLVHEIKNPLNFTRNGTEAIERRLAEVGVDDERVQRAAQIVRTGSDRILEVVDALGGLSRSKGGRPAPFDLRTAVADTLTLVEADLRQSGVAVEVTSTGDTVATCRPGEIRQVLLNLMTNAGQALEAAGGGQITVEVRGGTADVVVAVQDDGPGVPADMRARVFDPYFTTKDPGAGTGLGLSVAARIAEAHGGALRLADEVGPDGPGARFELTLPR